MHHTPTDLVGRTVGPYDLERLLGQGGFAWVFVGRELDGTPVAVKILKPRYAGDLQFESRFRNEAETAAQLRHPNIIHIHFVARSGNYVYFAMDLCADSLGERALALDAGPEAVGAQVHREVDVIPRARHEMDVNDVRVPELRGRLGLVPEPALELQVAGVAGLQDLDRDGCPVQFPTNEHPCEPTLAEQALEVVGADGAADEVRGRVGHEGFTNT